MVTTLALLQPTDSDPLDKGFDLSRSAIADLVHARRQSARGSRPEGKKAKSFRRKSITAQSFGTGPGSDRRRCRSRCLTQPACLLGPCPRQTPTPASGWIRLNPEQPSVQRLRSWASGDAAPDLPIVPWHDHITLFPGSSTDSHRTRPRGVVTTSTTPVALKSVLAVGQICGAPIQGRRNLEHEAQNRSGS
jgi:hypothetical protein